MLDKLRFNFEKSRLQYKIAKLDNRSKEATITQIAKCYSWCFEAGAKLSESESPIFVNQRTNPSLLAIRAASRVIRSSRPNFFSLGTNVDSYDLIFSAVKRVYDSYQYEYNPLINNAEKWKKHEGAHATVASNVGFGYSFSFELGIEKIETNLSQILIEPSICVFPLSLFSKHDYYERVRQICAATGDDVSTTDTMQIDEINKYLNGKS